MIFYSQNLYKVNMEYQFQFVLSKSHSIIFVLLLVFLRFLLFHIALQVIFRVGIVVLDAPEGLGMARGEEA